MLFVAFNVIIIALVLLIAYWWANQGLFSAILHLVCVVAAGAVALSVWEPIVVGLLLRGSGFDDYAWGVTLIVVFTLTLFILRVAMDKIVPGNVDLPRWTNLAFGFPIGAAAGVITIGMLIIGGGFIQSNNEIMGFKGRARSTQLAKIEQVNTLWAPVHVWTSEFYSFLSVGSLYPTFNKTPLRHYNPDLAFQAASLVRDSAAEGRGKLSLVPSAAQIQEFLFDPTQKRYYLRVRFDSKARDFGEQLTLSSSQIRLIGHAKEFAKPKTAHPDFWTQHSGRHRFDDRSHYITSLGGQSEATVMIEFPGGEFNNVHPRFVQIRNTRYRLPQPQDTSGAAVATNVGSSGNVAVPQGGKNIQVAVRQSNDIRPVSASTNQKPAGISVTNDYLIDGGDGDFPGGNRATSLKLSLKGIYEPTGTRIVQVDVARESPANLFAFADGAGAGAKIMLVDSQGRPYYPVGFIHQKPDGATRIKVDFANYLDTMAKIPALPTAGGQPLKLLFAVTVDATIVGLKLGDTTVGTCNLVVAESGSRSAPPPADTAGGAADENPE